MGGWPKKRLYSRLNSGSGPLHSVAALKGRVTVPSEDMRQIGERWFASPIAVHAPLTRFDERVSPVQSGRRAVPGPPSGSRAFLDERRVRISRMNSGGGPLPSVAALKGRVTVLFEDM